MAHRKKTRARKKSVLAPEQARTVRAFLKLFNATLTPGAKKDLAKMAREKFEPQPCPGDVLTDSQVDRAIRGAVDALKSKGIFVALAGYASYSCGEDADDQHSRDFFFFTPGDAVDLDACKLGLKVTKSIRGILTAMDKELVATAARIRGTGGRLPSFTMTQPKESV